MMRRASGLALVLALGLLALRPCAAGRGEHRRRAPRQSQWAGPPSPYDGGAPPGGPPRAPWRARAHGLGALRRPGGPPGLPAGRENYDRRDAPPLRPRGGPRAHRSARAAQSALPVGVRRRAPHQRRPTRRPPRRPPPGPRPPPLPPATAAAARGGDDAAGMCVKQLSDASAACSASLNGANKVAYGRLDRVFGSRGNGAFRLDTGRFFRLAVRGRARGRGRLGSRRAGKRAAARPGARPGWRPTPPPPPPPPGRLLPGCCGRARLVLQGRGAGAVAGVPGRLRVPRRGHAVHQGL
jgi:hypothetical protein